MTRRDTSTVTETVKNIQPTNNLIEKLGYNPHPDIEVWHGTPIPPCDNPLPASDKLVAIAKKMWWNGDPWTILRNRNAFLAHSMDWATHEDYLYLWNQIDRKDWINMLQQLQPGQVSTRSYRLCMRLAGLIPLGAPISKEWRANRHVKDLMFMNQRSAWEIRGGRHWEVGRCSYGFLNSSNWRILWSSDN